MDVTIEARSIMGFGKNINMECGGIENHMLDCFVEGHNDVLL